jgi:hypothetical protein
MRWTSRRKAEIVVAIEKGLITPEEAKRRYELSEEELAAWVRDYAAYGQDGLGVKIRRPRKRITQGQSRSPVAGWRSLPTSGELNTCC